MATVTISAKDVYTHNVTTANLNVGDTLTINLDISEVPALSMKYAYGIYKSDESQSSPDSIYSLPPLNWIWDSTFKRVGSGTGVISKQGIYTVNVASGGSRNGVILPYTKGPALFIVVGSPQQPRLAKPFVRVS